MCPSDDLRKIFFYYLKHEKVFDLRALLKTEYFFCRCLKMYFCRDIQHVQGTTFFVKPLIIFC